MPAPPSVRFPITMPRKYREERGLVVPLLALALGASLVALLHAWVHSPSAASTALQGIPPYLVREPATQHQHFATAGGGPSAAPSPCRHCIHEADQQLLRRLTEECVKRNDTVIYVDPVTRQMVVEPGLTLQACPVMDIALRGPERGVGMCTDVALYVLYAGARIISPPFGDLARAYTQTCGNTTSRMFLETMYGHFIDKSVSAPHIMSVNSEHLLKEHAALHAKMDMFLCKTRFCYRLMQRYIRMRGLSSVVWYMGHSSLDPLVAPAAAPSRGGRRSILDGSRPAGRAQQPMAAGGNGTTDYSRFLHVRGKSGLKHSKQVLECWARHPEWPQLTVVGDNPYEEHATQLALNASNIELLPHPTPHEHNLQQPDTITFDEIRQLQIKNGVHICASEREGFGHYLNEARAVGALVLTTDHPPMNELVTDGVTGLLEAPHHTGSWRDWQALWMYAHINAFMNPEEVCALVEKAMALPTAQRPRLGAAARSAYLAGHHAFVRRAAFLNAHLRQQLDLQAAYA